MTGPLTTADRMDGTVLWRRIANSLKAEIAAGGLGVGDRLPTEQALAERFGAHRHTVRRALAALAADGLVRAHQGRGAFVARAPLAYPIGRRTRFSEIVAAQAREPGGRLIGSGHEAADALVAARLGLAVGAEVVRLETLRVADGEPISLGTSWLPADRCGAVIRHYAETGSVTAALARCGIADYFRRETQVSARLAGAADALLLGITAADPILEVESVNVDDTGRPVQFTRARFVGSRVQLSFDTDERT